jgi:hypothetical protein
MSAFIVDKITIDRTVAGLIHFVGMPEDQADKIGRALWKMNREAVCQRYSRDEIMSECADLDIDGYQWDGETIATPLYSERRRQEVQAAKAMNCLLYQMSEGDVPKTLTYKTLASAVELAELDLIDRYMPKHNKAFANASGKPLNIYDLPGYSAAQWG